MRKHEGSLPKAIPDSMIMASFLKTHPARETVKPATAGVDAGAAGTMPVR